MLIERVNKEIKLTLVYFNKWDIIKKQYNKPNIY